MQNKKAYIIYTKRQYKKLNKIKKDVDKVSKGMLLSYCRKGEKIKIEIKSEIEIKIGYWYLDNHPLGKMNFEINFRMRNQKLKSIFG